MPQAVPACPASAYHANISLREVAGVSFAKADSSIALKGPISFPLNSVIHEDLTYLKFQSGFTLD